MAAQPVEWVLVIYYGSSAHRATYGRLGGTKYTKDYIQLTNKVLDTASRLFPVAAGGAGSVPLTYQWPAGTTPGEFVFKSADRPHLKWKTKLGAPKPWKMSLAPSEAAAETIPGNPSHLDVASAEKEFALLASRGAGQPYLMAIKLRDEPRTLHLRAYLANPSKKYAWADIQHAPQEIQALTKKTSQKKALKWEMFESGGTAPGASIKAALSQLATSDNPMPVIDALDEDTGRALAGYLRNPGYGLFFDPTRNHDAWVQPVPLSTQVAAFVDDFLRTLEARYPAVPQEDAVAERLEVDPDEVEVFRKQIEHESYEVADSVALVKTRGSAQRAFAEAVKTNYRFRCAITGIKTRDFLVASHIVPWSEDQSIRLDPSNGICLSLLMDRAFEKGYLLIEDNLTIRIDWDRVGDDRVLQSQLGPYDGQKLDVPAERGPKPDYLRRRRTKVVPTG